MFATKTDVELREEMWRRGLKAKASLTPMEMVHQLEEDERAKRRATTSNDVTTLATATGICVAIRLGDIGFTGYVGSYFYNSLTDSVFRLAVVCVFLGLASVASGVISFYRHKYVEQKHNPYLALILGLFHLQLIVEWWDGVQAGRKTDALKMLLNVGTVMNSIPLGFYFSYLGYFTQWTYALAIAVFLAMMSMGLTIISAEKELYIQRGLGKLPILAPYSLVLFLFRCVELPARVFSYTLFAARFYFFVFIVTGIDIIILFLIRASTIKRMIQKKDRSRDVLNRSIAELSKKHPDIDVAALESKLEDDDESDRLIHFTFKENLFHFIAWQLVYLEGIDAVPYFCLRILEIAAMTALFLLLDGGVSTLNNFQTSGLVVAAGFCAAYCLLSPVWQYYRSHASFLHPAFRQPTELQLKTLQALAERPLEAENPANGQGAAGAGSLSEKEEKSNNKPPVISEVSSHDSETDEKEVEATDANQESEEESEDDEDLEPSKPVVIVKEAPPPKECRTIEIQYNEDDFLHDPEIELEPEHVPTPLENRSGPKQPNNCRACVSAQNDSPNQCLAM